MDIHIFKDTGQPLTEVVRTATGSGWGIVSKIVHHEGVTTMRIIRISEVKEITSLSRSTIYKYMQQGEFPKPISLGGSAVGWVEGEVVEWITNKITERDEALPN